MDTHSLEIKCVSSLTKVFPDSALTESDICHTAQVLLNETASFQIAYRADCLVKRLHLKIDAGALPVTPVLQKVELVPSEMPGYGDEDDFVLKTSPGLFPDVLLPFSEAEELYAYPNQWRCIWVTLSAAPDAAPGTYPLHISISGTDDSTFGANRKWYGEETFTLSVLPAKLPEQKIAHTEWFSTDCLSTWYHAKPLSDRWWELVNSYLKNAADHGINMILTPVFTPPIETKIGSERLTVQLMNIVKTGDQYDFDFQNLEKWISIALASGIHYFEMPHLFTQWGAKFTPKIIVTENGETKKLFGWQVASEDPSYRNFLSQFLPALISCLEKYLDSDQVFFHISDEPGEDSLERYQRLSKLVRDLIGDYPLMDALSEYTIFEKSLLNPPVTVLDTVNNFLEKQVRPLWVYYACLENKNYIPNRFFAFPSLRNRIIGIQLYKFQIQGFLHWGYNHWYSGLSVKELDPFTNTDSDACFPSGDAFLVYPGENGPINSIRIEVLREAFQDYRALTLLESLTDREHVLSILEADIPPITFTEYPHDPVWLIDVRERINQAILHA